MSNGRHWLPWRTIKDPWLVLITEYLLARTRAGAVAASFPSISSRFNTPEAVLSAAEEWEDATRSLGLRTRSRRFIETSRDLVSRFGGSVPREREDLLSLPGVGHYTAAAVRCFAYGLPETLVDSNTIRIENRLSGVKASPSRHRGPLVRDHVARLYGEARGLPEENYALLDIGTTVCKSSVPVCGECPLGGTCVFATGQSLTEADSTGDATE